VLPFGQRYAIVLSGGQSKRLGAGVEKALTPLEGRPLIEYVLDAVTPVVAETIIVVKTEPQMEAIRDACNGRYRFTFALDESVASSPLIGALAGFRRAIGGLSLLLPCDAPLLCPDVLSLLLRLGSSYEAVVPRWPNGNIEPLHATYEAAAAAKEFAEAVEAGELRMYDGIKRLANVFYVPTNSLRRLDPCLQTFENVNTAEDLRRISAILQQPKYH
jgi:molybdopterin-guanine dinucleotide biosynthesis protein A